MNILFIIGNGFDLNLGLKTGYADFYNYYTELSSNDETIKNFKNTIADNIKNWSDLELSLGKYTEELKSENELDVIYDDLLTHLSTYLIKEENDFDFSKINLKEFYDSLISPECVLPRADKDVLQAFIAKNDTTKPWDINIITFNYTASLEKILNNKQNISIGHSKLGYLNRINIENIFHVHGTTNEHMVVGVNDIAQIANTSFKDNINILDTMVKSDCNKAMKHNNDKICKHIINQANLIYIFGSSLGDTDNLWWNLIIQKLENSKDSCRLVIFSKDSSLTRLSSG